MLKVTIPAVLFDPDLGSDIETIAGAAMALLATIITSVWIPAIRRWARKNRAEEEASNANRRLSEQQTLALLSQRVKVTILNLAELTADREFPKLAQSIHDQKIRSAWEVKEVLHSWAHLVRQSIYAQYAAQDVNLSHTLGDFWVHDAIDRAAVEVSPFPGKDTAVALLSGGAEEILKYGVDYVRNLNVIHPTGAPPQPPSVTAAIAAVGVPPSVKPIAVPPPGGIAGSGSGSQ